MIALGESIGTEPLSFIDNNLKMVFTDPLVCLFPSHLAMLVWQMVGDFWF
jgi:hypothetical protein